MLESQNLGEGGNYGRGLMFAQEILKKSVENFNATYLIPKFKPLIYKMKQVLICTKPILDFLN